MVGFPSAAANESSFPAVAEQASHLEAKQTHDDSKSNNKTMSHYSL